MEKEKYLIAFDLDNTLLTSKKTISKSTIRYLKKLQKQGNILTIASGRPDTFTEIFYNQLNMSGLVTTYNGQKVYNPKNKECVLLDQYMNSVDIVKLFNMTTLDIYNDYYVETDDEVYMSNKTDFNKLFFTGTKKIYLDCIDKLHGKVRAVNFNLVNKDCSKILSDAIKNVSSLYITFWGNELLCGTINVASSNKWIGLKCIMDYYKIDENHTIAFGDDDNDLSMLLNVKYGFAMCNSNPRVLDKITTLTKFDSDHDGVERKLKEFFKTQR